MTQVSPITRKKQVDIFLLPGMTYCILRPVSSARDNTKQARNTMKPVDLDALITFIEVWGSESTSYLPRNRLLSRAEDTGRRIQYVIPGSNKHVHLYVCMFATLGSVRFQVVIAAPGDLEMLSG